MLWTVTILAGLWSLVVIVVGVGGLIIFVTPAGVVLDFSRRAICRRNQPNWNR